MARYCASAGIKARRAPYNVNAERNLRHDPVIVLFGPSGQACQVFHPSGVAGAYPANNIALLQAYNQSFNHRAIGWYKNRLYLSFQVATSNIGPYAYAWAPYGLDDFVRVNQYQYTPYNNAKLSERVMFDGHNWIHWNHKLYTTYPRFENIAHLGQVGGKMFWFGNETTHANEAMYGLYDGTDPVYRDDSGGRSGWWPRPGAYGSWGLPTQEAAFMLDTTTNVTYDDPDGVEHDRPSPDIATNPCDMIYHKGTIYVANQYYVTAVIPGLKPNFIQHNYPDDSSANDCNESANYTSRAETGVEANTSKSFAIHNGTLYMLRADGKVYRVTPHKLFEVADLTQLGTAWSSGITYGTCPTVGASDSWGGTNGRRCFLASFNNQLHAFLNFSTNWRVVKGTDETTAGRGVFWATSFDAENWTDFSQNLPASGIISPSGNSGARQTEYLRIISPYRFSGRVAHSDYTSFQAMASGLGSPAEPSGFRQTGPIPFWLGSGSLMDDSYTTYDALSVPLEHGAISGYLFPTQVRIPASYRTNSSGVFVAEGVGASGWDYTGCTTYHISGFSDNDTKTLKVCFSQDNTGGTDVWNRGRALYYELNKSSGWLQRNYLPHVNQLNGFIPIDLYDPEIIISSGTLYNPNPRVNSANKSVTVKYRIHDWPYWGNITVIGEYSTDGLTWSQFYKKKNLSTGSIASDPSGVIGTEYTTTWHYDSVLSSNTEFNNVQIRFRGEAAL